MGATGRAWLEDQRRRGDRTLNLSVEHLPDVIFRLDNDFRYTYISPAIERHSGISQDQFVGKVLQNIQAPGYDADGLAGKCHEAVAHRREVEREFTTGGRHYRTRIIPEPDPDGSVGSLLGITEDITDRKLADERVLEREQHYESLVHKLDGIVWEVDYATWRFTLVSDQAERILGYPVKQWLEDPDFWPNHIHPDDRDWAARFCMESTEQCQDHQFEYRMIAADGRIVWLRDIVSVESKDGRPVRLRGLMVDLTERKKEEAFRAGQTRILEMIATGARLSDILTNLVMLVESQSGRMFCSVLLLSDDGITMRHGAAPSLPELYTKAIDGVRIGPKVGSCGTAMYLGRPVLVTDVLEDPLWEDYRGLTEVFGFRACWSSPILSSRGEVLARSPCITPSLVDQARKRRG